MIHMHLGEAAQYLNANIKSEHALLSFQGISIDTRSLKPGNLFFAITGTHLDGHEFIHSAYRKGAIAAVVAKESNCPIPQIKVSDTTLALGQLSSAWRHQFNLPIIGVTGSNGKTTLKNMLASILIAACHGNTDHVLATQGTLNNHWGLPLTLSQLNNDHLFAVIEMGMNHFGEIEYLTQLTHPQVAIITNAAPCHLEGVIDLAGVAKAKAEIFKGLDAKGIAILNRDDAFYDYWRDQLNQQCISFGFHEEADVRASIQSNSKINVHLPNESLEINLPLLGKHNIMNALAAAAGAYAIQIKPEAIKTGLENCVPAKGRLQLHTLKNGVIIIDDTYNANPFSLEAAVHTLATFNGKKILVLGDMKELGDEAESIHQNAGTSIRNAGIDFLFTYGKLSEHTATAFGEGAYHFNEQNKLITALKPFLYNQATILIKGSRSMNMEQVVYELIE